MRRKFIDYLVPVPFLVKPILMVPVIKKESHRNKREQAAFVCSLEYVFTLKRVLQ